VQRISRYPLFINAMMDNTLPDSEEKEHLKGITVTLGGRWGYIIIICFFMRTCMWHNIIDALGAMTHVADYINEVQRLCETYGTVLDSFLKDQALPEVRFNAL
jgi:hypothetical protein